MSILLNLPFPPGRHDEEEHQHNHRAHEHENKSGNRHKKVAPGHLRPQRPARCRAREVQHRKKLNEARLRSRNNETEDFPRKRGALHPPRSSGEQRARKLKTRLGVGEEGTAQASHGDGAREDPGDRETQERYAV